MFSVFRDRFTFHMAVLATFKLLSSADVASILLPDLIVHGLHFQLVAGMSTVHGHSPGLAIIITDGPHSSGIVDGSYICVQPQAHELSITSSTDRAPGFPSEPARAASTNGTNF